MVLCVVVGCSKRSGRDKDVSFFRLPRIIKNKGVDVHSLSKRRRDGILAAISRVGLTDNILKNDRICFRHYISGKPADLLDDTNPDWLPTLNLGHNKARLPPTATGRWERWNARQANREDTTHQVTDTMLTETSDADDTHVDLATQVAVATADASTQFGIDVSYDVASTQTDSSMMDASTQTYLHINYPPLFSEEAVLPAEYIKFYTGLPNCKVLKAVFNLIKPGISHHNQSKLTPFQEYIMVLMKLRLNTQIQDLAYRFGISSSTVSRLFLKWVITMNHRLKHLILWPNRDSLIRTMPACFQKSFGKKVAIVIDCFEVFLERPSNLHARACTWSNYKHLKILLGIAPQGVISFVSSTWGGRVSDKYITDHSGVLDNLIPGDVVLADRGFDIGDSVGMMQASLHIPAFTKGKSQLTAMEVHETRSIANVRIHVKRVIGMVRQKYSILQSTLPIHYVHKRERQPPLIDSIVSVCCALCNICDSVVPFD